MSGGGNLVRGTRYKKTPRARRSAHSQYYYTRSLVLESPRRPITPTRCHSAPRVMDSHSRSASPREPSRPLHRPPSPPSPPASFDNRAYQHDEDPNHNDSFTSNGPQQQNGHNKEPNGDTKTLEAVNLELINLTPKNGNTKKKDVEVDMNSTNPYDEYFVPVNEHRKYMRGEKLYVTQDKRGEKGGCKRPLCWTLLALVVAAVVALIVLAATGVLVTNSPTPLEQYNSSISSARAFGGLGQDQDHDHDHDQDDDHEHDPSHNHSMDVTTEHQHGPDTQTQNDEGENPMGSDDINDSAMYVRRTLEGELKIDNEDFTPLLQDPDSEVYRDFAANLADTIKRALFDRNALENGDHDVAVEVIKLRKGSVIVTYRIHWRPKNSAEHSEDLLTATTLQMNLENYLDKNSRMLSIYHVAEDKLTARQVLDLCQINKNDCDHGCAFDETTLDFTCTCPRGQILAMTNPKKCVSIFEEPKVTENNPTEDAKMKEFRVLDLDSTSRTKQIPEEEKPNTESVHVVDSNKFDWKETHHIMPEATTETDPDLKFSHIFGHPRDNYNDRGSETPQPEPTAEPEPNSSIVPNLAEEPKAASTSTPKTESKSALEPTSEPEPHLNLVSESEPKPEPELIQEQQSETEPRPEPEPASEPQSSSEPAPTKASPLETEINSQPAPEETLELAERQWKHKLLAEPEPSAEPQSTVEPVPQHVTESEPQSEPEPHPAVESQPASEPEPTSEPEPISEPQPTSEPQFNSEIRANHESKKEAHENTQVELNSNININDHIQDSQNSDETEKNMETIKISKSEPNTINEPTYKPNGNVLSVLSANWQRHNDSGPFLTSSENHETSTDNEWLEDALQNDKHVNNDSLTSDNPNINTETSTTSYMDYINENRDSVTMHETQDRSFKSFQNELSVETTTILHVNKTDTDVLLDLMRKENVERKPTENTDKEDSTTIMPSSSTSTYTELNHKNNQLDTTTINIMEIIEPNIQTFSAASETLNINNSKNTDKSADSTSNITSLIEEARLLQSVDIKQAETAVPEPETITEYSIRNYEAEPEDDKSLVAALETQNISKSIQTTEKGPVDEGTDITFDAINMFFNRSSKSIENQNQTGEEITTNQPTTEQNDLNTLTTESDWLYEPVTEVKYDDLMNKMDKQATIAPTTNKIAEIGLPKDDFEPDYLNNMGSTKIPDQNEPVYGMIHDYDNEDTRVKRVNAELKEISTDKMITKDTHILHNTTTAMVTKGNLTDNASETLSSTTFIETTTVGQYILKAAEKTINTTEMFTQMENDEKSAHEPAPVWEESDLEKELTVTEVADKVNNNSGHNHSDNNTLQTISTISPTAVETQTKLDTLENEAQNTTQVNNLNVTIYEISNHNRNNSFLGSKSHPHSAEYEDHETEMNPFLPETENNKSLVKKLQEGHDLEPANLNETQNENIEDHNAHLNETQNDVTGEHGVKSSDKYVSSSSSEGSSEFGSKDAEELSTSTTEDDASINELLMNENYNEEEETNINETKTAKNRKLLENKSSVPISTFLVDTDDLDVANTQKPEFKSTMAENKLENDDAHIETTTGSKNVDDNNDYLSVVPITEDKVNEKEALKKNYKSESIHELNDISDSPKKSDRRTIEYATKLESVINNEA